MFKWIKSSLGVVLFQSFPPKIRLLLKTIVFVYHSLSIAQDLVIRFFRLHKSVKSHSEIGACRTVRGEKSAVVGIVPQVFAIVRFARIFLCDSPFS